MTLYEFVAETDVDLEVAIFHLKEALGVMDQACGAAKDDGEAAKLARMGAAIFAASGLLQQMRDHFEEVEAES